MTLKNKQKIRKNKTRKRRDLKILKAICVLHKNKNGVDGIVKFHQKSNSSMVKVSYNINGLSDGEHGFHIHEYGDLTDGCMSSCAHFNPFNVIHGGRKSKIRHVGDLGNILSKNGIAKGYFYDKIISLDVKNICSIIGRAVVVHKDRDDLGMGGDKESLITGNAGKRLACGIIGLEKRC